MFPVLTPYFPFFKTILKLNLVSFEHLKKFSLPIQEVKMDYFASGAFMGFIYIRFSLTKRCAILYNIVLFSEYDIARCRYF